MLAMLFLLLLGDGLVLSKVQAAGGPTAQRWVDALHAIERRMNLYVRSVCIVHGSIGVLFALFGWLWGMPSPWLWGTLVAVGNAIPFVGPLVVTGVLTIVALTSFDATGVAMVPPLVYVLLHVVENNVVTPCLLGRWLSLSPVAIFVMLTVMGFLWGVPGLVLAVPLLVVARISSDYVPAMQPLQLLLDGRAGVAPSAPAATPAAATIRPAMPVTEVSR
jgi:predicted PurR-regulated permease PerM